MFGLLPNAKCVRFARDYAAEEDGESGDHADSGNQVIPDPVIESSSMWTKADFLHEPFEGSDGIDEVLAAFRRDIGGLDDVQGSNVGRRFGEACRDDVGCFEAEGFDRRGRCWSGAR